MNLPRLWLLIRRAPGIMALRPTQLIAIAVLVLAAPGLHAQSPSVSTKTIDVDGIATRYHAAGLETRSPGQPVVVLQSGGGGTPLENWAGVLAGLQGRAAALAYDRPGIGGTSFPEEPLTLTFTFVNDHLRDLLKALEIAPPYILVGHSWGGRLILEYASRHPDEVAGSVYVDPATFLQTEDDQREMFRAIAPKGQDADSLWDEAAAMAQQAQAAGFDRMPPGVRAEMELGMNLDEGKWRDAVPPEHPVTILLGFRPMPGPLPPFPGDPMEFFRAERELTLTQFEEWIEGHPNSSVRVLPESSHLVPDEAPEAIVEAIEAILQTLDVKEGASG